MIEFITLLVTLFIVSIFSIMTKSYFTIISCWLAECIATTYYVVTVFGRHWFFGGLLSIPITIATVVMLIKLTLDDDED